MFWFAIQVQNDTQPGKWDVRGDLVGVRKDDFNGFGMGTVVI